MLPKDTISYIYHIPAQGAGNYIITNQAPNTILSISFLQGNQGNISGNTILKCNGVEIFRNFSKDTYFNFVNIPCPVGALSLTKTGNDEAEILVNYIPYIDKSTTTPKFTYGEILTNYFILIIMVGLVFGFFVKKLLK